jgi:(5-formylfuran-3-yl)methyl phosphate synthase
MQLLVSVRSAEEVEHALAGGADIIDAKEPANGSLGAVSATTLAEVVSLIPSTQELSIALGDVVSVAEVVALIDRLELPSRAAPTYLKLGFAGVESRDMVREILGAAVQEADRRFPVTIIAVAYADAARVTALSAETMVQLAAAAGAGGVLIDTHLKDGTRLLDWRTPESLAAWIFLARGSNLVVGVAGALRADDIPAVALADPDVIGFRGAACEAGRVSRVSPERVALLRSCLDAAAKPPWAVLPISQGHGETRDSEPLSEA